MSTNSAQIVKGHEPEDYIDQSWKQGWVLRIFDAIFTGVMWGIFIYLISNVPTLFTLGREGVTQSLDQSTTPYGFIETFGGYMLVIVINAILFIVWACYNCWRFRDKEKRKFEKPVSIDETAVYFETDPVLVQAWQNTQRIVINYDAKQQMQYYG